MGIGKIGYDNYSNFVSDYRINSIPKAEEIEKVVPVTPVTKIEPTSKNNELLIEEVDNRPASIDPNEVSLSFNKGEDYSYIGRDKEITNLDMEKAISAMRQDSILQEYQYFVGSADNIFASEDGVVIAK